MIKSELKFYLNPEFEKSGIEKEEKTIKLFGIVIFRKTVYYPKLKEDDLFSTIGVNF
ncbi:hypothetical protein K5L04_09480 [Flavobacterium psychrophilum]|uniref:hypothetical protein n=1 Tax=Flavobacterium psychrophilum TaxID=96345 RepID=UPI000A67C67F|nr:hypothetical protein [Flavobacterium psychrophilum]ELY1979200.1 hypothetical protein [Flavobacterium psychrophilum]MBF2092580.1 hypothetical protein [Flavobacterium psychrophilum]MEB3380723.1 hypothetical protein [Flavobacterium psychrophilum]QZK99927.1 hypothetical protein K5L04_09480 [Flavobacterium psychrophilum]SNA87621.1 hypothetical protein DK095_70027 [Flavobacterium psychrophilum]